MESHTLPPPTSSGNSRLNRTNSAGQDGKDGLGIAQRWQFSGSPSKNYPSKHSSPAWRAGSGPEGTVGVQGCTESPPRPTGFGQAEKAWFTEVLSDEDVLGLQAWRVTWTPLSTLLTPVRPLCKQLI